MGAPQRESFDGNKRYKSVLEIAGRNAQDFSFNEQWRILDTERERLGTRVFKSGAIVDGVVASVGTGGALNCSEGQVYIQGRVEPVAAAALAFSPSKTSGIDVVYLRWLLDQVTLEQDADLAEPGTGDEVDERLRVTAVLVNATPDVLDEQFLDFGVSGGNEIPRDWSFAGAGSCHRGYPSKYGETAVLLTHVTGTETKLEREILLTPSTLYRVYFHVRTAAGGVDLGLGHGAFVDLERASPSWTPNDFPVATSDVYARNAFQVTSDGNPQTVRIRVVIPALAPSTSILLDAMLITTLPLGGLDWDRHYVPMLFWDRATNKITRAIERISNLHGSDLMPPFRGEDIEGLERNQGLLDDLATTVWDENQHYRIPPGLETQRDPSLDDSTHIGLRVTAGRAYVRGYRVTLPLATPFALAKALSTLAVDLEAQTFHFGTNRYLLNKAAGAVPYPIQQIRAVTMDVLQQVQVTKGTGNGTDVLGAGSITDILAADGGNGASAGSLTGTQAGPFVFTEANNRLRLKVVNFDGTAGAFQEIKFARGSYTRTEVLEALQRGSGRAMRSGKVVGNVEFIDTGSAIRVRTLTKHAGATVQVDSEANGSTANTLLGLASGGATSSDGAGTHYAETTDWVRAGNDISWAPGGSEPTSGHTYTVVVRRTISAIANTDYKLGGIFGSAATDLYRVTTWGPNGEGLISVTVSRARVAGDVTRLTWNAVANALSYHVYRSGDGGSTYDFLRNVVDPTAGAGTGAVTFDDDGSKTPDSSVHPPIAPSTATGRANTVLNGAVVAGATSIIAVDTTGFPNSGTLFIGGSEHATYTGRTDTTFTGIPASGAGSIGADWANASAVTQGPGMSVVSIALGNLGIVNFTPLGQVAFTATRGEPEDGRSILVSYDYYQPRVDRLVIDRFGLISTIRGIPADDPMPPAVPAEVMELAQVRIQANSSDLLIARIDAGMRLTMADLRQMLYRVDQLYAIAIDQSIRNQARSQDASAKGVFADALASLDQVDIDYDRSGVTFNAAVDTVLRVLSPPRALVEKTISNGTLARNAGQSTEVAIGEFSVLPSTEVTLIAQTQWSEMMPVNPYSAYFPPEAELRLTPDHVTWSLRAVAGAIPFLYAAEVDLVLAALRTSVIPLGQVIPPWIIDLQRELEDARMRAVRQPSGWPPAIVWPPAGDLRKFFLSFRPGSFIPAGHLMLDNIRIRVEGKFFGSLEDNIELSFDGHPLAIDPGDILEGTAATQAGKLKATDQGTLAFMGGPSDAQTWLSAIGIHEVKMAGPQRSGRASFTGMLTLPPGTRTRLTDPLAQSFSFPETRTVSAVSLWFESKDDAGIPLTVQLREMANGLPGPNVLAQTTVFPSAITPGVETKIAFDRYITIPANTSVALVVSTHSAKYAVQIARLNKLGKVPVALISQNPYDPGALFTSSNNETWLADPAADLRFKVYGRTFTSPAVLELSPVSGLTATDLWVGADQAIVPGTHITWEFELNGDGVPRPLEAFEKRPCNVLGTSVIIRAKLSTDDPNVSPSIVRNSIGLAVFTNALAGTGVWIAIPSSQPLTTGRVLFTAARPSGTTVVPYLSNDDGVTWAPMVLDTSTALDNVWAEEAYKIDPAYHSGQFADTSKQTMRLRIEMTAADRLVIPRIGRIGATVS